MPEVDVDQVQPGRWEASCRGCTWREELEPGSGRREALILALDHTCWGWFR